MICTFGKIWFCIVLTSTLRFVSFSNATTRSHFCSSAQDGTIGEEGIIRCNVTPGFVGVYWFDESSDRDPLIRYEDNVIFGRQNDRYSIKEDGSLVIKTVSQDHGGFYKLVVFDKNFNDFEEIIRFDVIEKPPGTNSRHQQGKLGSMALIKWNIEKGFEGVYWFENTNDHDPVVRYEEGVKSGPLYPVEYDICSNGSLVIQNVTEKYHDRIFKLLVIDANFDVLQESIRFSVTGLQDKEHLPTVPLTMESVNLTFTSQSPQPSQSPSDQTSEQLLTSMSSTSLLNSSTTYDGETESSTHVENVKTSHQLITSLAPQGTTGSSADVTIRHPSFRTVLPHESRIPSIDNDDSNSSKKMSSYRCLHLSLFLFCILFHV